MKLSCALVLALTNLVIATPFSFSVKGSGSPFKVDPTAASFGTFGIAQTGYSGSVSKPSSSSFASSSGSQSSGSFSYNSAQTGVPAYNSASYVASSQTVGQNVAGAPQAFATAVPNNYNVGSSDVNGISQHANTVSKFQYQDSEQKPGVYSRPHSSVSQDVSKSNVFESTVSSANAAVSGSSSSKYYNGVQGNADTASNFQHQLVSTQQQNGHFGINSNVPESQGNLQGNVFVSTESPAFFAVSSSQSPKDVNGALSSFHGLVEKDQKPGLHLGSNQHTFGSQNILKPDGFVSNVDSGEPEKFNKPSTVQSVSSHIINSGSVSTVSTVQDQATPSVEKKPIYSSGFGGPPGVLNPYDKVSISGVSNNAGSSYQPNQKPSDFVNTKPQVLSYTPVNNGNPSYSSSFQQQQQTGVYKPIQSVSTGYVTPNSQSFYKPGIKPTKTNENKPSYVKDNERPSSEFKPTNDAQVTGDKYVNQRPEVEYSHSSEFSGTYASHDVKPGYQSFNQEQHKEKPTQSGIQYDTSYIATESAEKLKPTKEPSYNGGFGAPAGVFKPFQATLSEVHKFASTTVKPDSAKPNVGYPAAETEENKYSSNFYETNPTQKPSFESTSYQSFDISSSPASYVTLKPTSSHISSSEQYIQTSSFGIPTTAESIKQQGEDQSIPKPSESSPVNPNPDVEISSQYKPVNTNAFGLSTTTKPSSLQVYEQFPSTPVPWGYGSSDVSGSVDKTKPNNQLVSSDQNKPSLSGSFADQLEAQKPFYQPYHTGKPINQVSFDKTKPSVQGTPTDFSGISQQPTNKPSFGGFLDNIPVELNNAQKPISNTFNKDTKVSYSFSNNAEPQSPNKPTVNQNKPFYSNSFGTLTGSTGYISSSSNTGQSGQPISDSYSITGSVSQNSNTQKHTDKNTSVPEKTSSEQQKFTNQAFTSNSAHSNGATTFGSKPQHQQQPTIQSDVQKKPWNTNWSGASVTAKPYNRYPGFSSSFTSFGHGSSVTSGSFDKTKQTTQFISTGQYSPTSSGQYKPLSTGQYKPYNWGVGGQQGVQKFSNVHPTSGYFVSTYAPTTFKPFVTSSPFDKSKASNSFSGNKESTYVSGVGSPLSVTTTTKPSWLSQTSYKPDSGFSSSAGFFENPKVSANFVSTTPKYETPKNQLGQTHSNEASYLTQNSGSLVISTSGQSSFSSVKPTVDLPTHSSQFEANSERVKPTTESPTGTVGYYPNESGLNVEVTKVSDSYYTPAPLTVESSVTENKPHSEIYVQSFGSKPSTSFTSQNKIDEKVQISSTPKPASSFYLNKEKPAFVGSFEGASYSLKPTNQPFISTSSYYFDKEGPTQISAIKPANYGSSNEDTLSHNKAEEEVQFTQTSKPEWSSSSNHKESTFVSSLGGTSYELKPTGQPILSTSSYSYDKEVTPTQFDYKKPSNYGTFSGTNSASFATGSTGFSHFDSSHKQPSQSDLSSTNQGDSKGHSSPLFVPNKPVYSSSFQQPSSQVINTSSLSTFGTVSESVDSPKPNKPFSANHNTQYNSGSYESTPEHLVSPKPSQVSVFEKEPGFVVTYKEKETNQGSFISSHAKPTTAYAISEDPTKVSLTTLSSVSDAQKFNQVNKVNQASNGGLYDSSKQSNQQSWGFSSNKGAQQSTQASYVGVFGGPAGILKPNNFGKQPQQQYIQTQYKPSYNNQATWGTQSNSHTTVSSNAASYTGGFGAPAGVLTANENIKPNSFGHAHNVNKYASNVQASGFHGLAGQNGVSQSQEFTGQKLNAATSASAGGFLNSQQTQFSVGVSSGTRVKKDINKFSGQFSGSKAFGSVGKDVIFTTLV